MRILYFSRDYTPHDHRFLSALAETEHQIYYLRLENKLSQITNLPIPQAIEKVDWAGGRGSVGAIDGPRLYLSLKGVIQRVKPDLIQAGPMQTSAFLVAMTGFRPLVSMSWGYDLLQDADRNVFWRRATKFTLSRSDVMIGDCDTVRKKAVSLGMVNDRITTFPWGVDLNHFTPDDLHVRKAGRMNDKVNKSPFSLLSTRGWAPIYGVDVIAKAFVVAARECSNLRLIMLGNGPQRDKLRKIFNEGDVLDRVDFKGQVNKRDLPIYYRSADLYVSASHIDGTSISLLEAMACACPVLVSDIPGNKEWVTHGKEGWYFPDGDVYSLARAILNAVKERNRLPEMGRSARNLAEKRADWSKNFPHLLNAYSQIMDVVDV